MKVFNFLSIICLTLSSAAFSATLEPATDTLDAVFNAAEPGSADQKVYTFCTNLLSTATPETLEQTREIVAQTIYLYELDKAATAAIIDPTDTNGTKTKIILQFAKAMHNLSQTLMKLKIAHQITGLQNANMAVAESLPRAIAHCLLTSAGKINGGIAPGIKRYLIPSAALDYQKDITRFLDLLDQIGLDKTKSIAWENIFNSVQKPLKQDAPANLMIRATLGLPADTVITDNHAKEAFLYFFMGHARQGAVGDCFEEWWKITVKDGLWHTLAQDGIQLLKYSGLVRSVSGSQQTFPFVYSIADDNLQNKVILDQNGKLRTGANIFDAPGIKNAALQMGITDISTVASGALSLLLGTKTSDTKTAQDIIDALAKISIQKGLNGGKDFDTLSNIGYFAFSTENTCAPLEMYGSCLASFAEDVNNDAVRGTVLYAVDHALNSQWHAGTLPWQHSAIEKFKNLFFSTLNSQFELYYDERVELKTPAADGSSTAGAFQMHRMTGELVAGPEDFQKLVLDSLNLAKSAAGQQSKSNLISPMMFRWMHETTNKISNYIKKSQNFLKITLWNYNADNKKIADPVANWEQLAHTPWLDQTGDNPEAVYEIATGMMLPKATSVIPNNAQQLAASFIQFARNLEQTQHYLENSAFIGRIPVWNTIHAYNGLLDNPGVIAAVQSTLSVDDWLSTRLYQPGHMIAITPISKSLADTLVQQLAAAMPDSDRSAFLAKAAGVYKDSINIRDFNRQLIKTVTALSSKYAGSQVYNQISQLLTSTLLEALPQNMLSVLADSAVQAFDTNWYTDTTEQGQAINEEDIHFCFFFDPISEDILLGTIDEDNTQLQPIDQNQWVIGQEWDFTPAILTDSLK